MNFRRTIRLFLFAMILSLGSLFQFAQAKEEIKIPTGQEEEGDLTREEAQAYLDLLQQYKQKYGTSNGKTVGLAYQKLLDFNGDGVMELYLTYVVEEYNAVLYSSRLSLKEELWTLDQGAPVQVYSASENASYTTEMETQENLEEISRKLIISEEKAYMRKDFSWEQSQESQETISLSAYENKSLQQKDFFSFFWKLDYVVDEETLDFTLETLMISLFHNQQEIPITSKDQYLTYFGQIYKFYEEVQSIEVYKKSGGNLSWQLASCESELEEVANAAYDHYHGYQAIFGQDNLTFDIQTTISKENEGEILVIFQLNTELYYVVVDVNGKQHSHIIYQGTEDGSPYYGILHSASENMEITEIWQQISTFQNSANICIDYSILHEFSQPEDFVQHLQNALSHVTGTSLNQHALQEIAQYMKISLAGMGSTNAFAQNNQVTIGKEMVESALQRQNQLNSLFEEVLKEENATPNSAIQKTLQVFVHQLDREQAMTFQLQKSLLALLEPAMNLKIMVAGSQYALEISMEQLQILLDGADSVNITLEKLSEKSYDLSFSLGSGTKINKTNAPIMLTLPATSAMDTVIVKYLGGADNWGGQWDSLNKTIIFSTSFAGEYEINTQNLDISDMDQLTESEKEMVEFMVSKGFFQLEQGQFLPEKSFSRYDFAQALVGMFFALERELSCTFIDVSPDSPYYDIIASAQAKNLVAGYDETSYRGDLNITEEQVLVIIARTLSEENGYRYPDNLQEFLVFSGADKVSSWAEAAASLCFREGIILRGAHIYATAEITRLQAAVYLYRLYQLLYEVDPVSHIITEEIPLSHTETLLKTTAIVGIGWSVLLMLGLICIKNRKKKQSKT